MQNKQDTEKKSKKRLKLAVRDLQPSKDVKGGLIGILSQRKE
jgi:hypothetical protein